MTRDDGSSGERRVVKEKMTQKLLKKERSSQLQGRKRKQNLHFTPTNHHFRLLTTTSRAERIWVYAKLALDPRDSKHRVVTPT
jgi:hypothetical protein